MDPAAYMVRVPVPFIFGTIVVQNMLKGSLFAKHAQPVKGLLECRRGPRDRRVAVLDVRQVGPARHGERPPRSTDVQLLRFGWRRRC